jgi:O-antigen/teichoic acid export membrane protein
MASVVLGFLDALAEFNVETALVRSTAVGRPHYDSAWTLQVIEGMVKTGLLIAVAPFIAAYYGDPRIEIVVYIMALRPAIEGFENIGQVDFRRELQFDKEFRYWVYRRVLSFLLTIGIALWLRNYLALAIAAPITAISTVVLSYAMSAYRPHFALSRIREIWAFSKWWILFGSVRFFGNRGEEFILGGLTTPGVVGAYAVGGDFSGLLTQEAVLPVGRVLVPSYAKISDKPTQLLRTFQVSFGILATISLAAGIGASLVAENLVLVVLGAQWGLAVPYFRWLALHSAFWCIVQCTGPYFMVTNREKLYALCNLGYLVVLVPAIFIAAHTAGVDAVALAVAETRTAVTLAFMLGMLGLLLALGAFSLGKLVDVLWRPLVACLVMAVCVLSIGVGVGTPQIVSLAIQVSTGVAVFFMTLVLLWVSSGRPSGTETAIFSLASDYISVARRH